jgi:PKD repeat protein
MINNFFKNKSINKLRYTVRWGGYDNTIIPKMIRKNTTQNGNGYTSNENQNGGKNKNGNGQTYNGGNGAGLYKDRFTGYASTGQTLSGIQPLTVNFSNTSTGDNLSWMWNFGDGGTSSQQSPTYTYQAVGNYTVALTTTNNYGSDTKTGTITVQSQTGGE